VEQPDRPGHSRRHCDLWDGRASCPAASAIRGYAALDCGMPRPGVLLSGLMSVSLPDSAIRRRSRLDGAFRNCWGG